ATPSEVEGMTRFSLYTLSTYKFTRPMFMLPKADLALNIWLFRRVPIADKSRYPEAVAAVRSLAESARGIGQDLSPLCSLFHAARLVGPLRSPSVASPRRWERAVRPKRRSHAGDGMFGTMTSVLEKVSGLVFANSTLTARGES